MAMIDERLTAVFHALSDPGRLTILQHLKTGEHRVRDLTDHLHLAQSTVSAHLACLRDCGLVGSRPDGRASLWSLTAEPETDRILEAGAALVGAMAPNDPHHTDAAHRVAILAAPRSEART
ncbi:MAG TPA: metalloregulator ArsR/SmtB family transcription factor [Bacillota bacterium]|nr:metalloregulator ArsR/SmtB family transcription factor [Bacillota bacterium]